MLGALCIIENRNDYALASVWPPRWTTTAPPAMYYEGNILRIFTFCLSYKGRRVLKFILSAGLPFSGVKSC